MQYREFGEPQADTVVLLHGGGLSWWNYRDAAKRLQASYHVMLPILDGHAGSDRPFTSIEDNAAALIDWIDAHLGGRVTVLGGLSLGAQIALEMLSQRPDIARCALIESASVLPQRVTHALVGPTFGSSYGLMKSRSFAALQFRSLHMPPALFEDYYRDTCAIEKTDMIAFLKASTAYTAKPSLCDTTAVVQLYAGARETGTVLRSAKRLHTMLPQSTLTVLPGLHHGEFSMRHAARYAEAVQKISETGENLR